MDRTLENPRKERFSYRMETVKEKFPKEFIIQPTTIINENGDISVVNETIEYNTAEILKANKPYMSKIEYIKKYGTIDKTGVIKYSFARTHEIDGEIVKNVIQNALKNKEN